MKKLILFNLAVLFLLVSACTTGDDTNTTGDSFDRKALLVNLADNLIIPAYENFAADMTSLDVAANDFVSNATVANLDRLRAAWEQAFISWQSVSMYEIGKAEQLSYRNFMNVFPVSVENIEQNIATGVYDFNTVSKQDEQGFGALDYLLNGLRETDQELVDLYTMESSQGYKTYLMDVVQRMKALTDQVLSDWKNGYRDAFVNNSGSSATSSLDKIANDFIFHYEKHLRAGKIGIPAGVFSVTILDNKVEAYYKKDLSKTLFLANLDAMKDVFNGKYFNSNTEGESFKTYLNFLNTIKDGDDLAAIINTQFGKARTTGANLNDNFSEQVKTANSLMLNTYDELQKNVVHIKVDMLQALNVSVDFIDADGD